MRDDVIAQVQALRKIVDDQEHVLGIVRGAAFAWFRVQLDAILAASRAEPDETSERLERLECDVADLNHGGAVADSLRRGHPRG